MTSTVIAYVVIIFILSEVLKRTGFKVSIWFPAFLFLLLNASASIFISYVTAKLVPANYVVQSNSTPVLSLVIGAVIFLLGATTFYKRKTTDTKIQKNENKVFAWCLYALGAILIVISYYAVMVSVFSPQIFNSDTPAPQIGVYIYVGLSVPISMLLYYLARFSFAPDKENYFRWQSLFAGFYCVLITSLLSLMLIYSTRTTPKTAYPLYANLMTIAYLPFSLLIFSLVPGNMRRNEIKTEKSV